jgi:hypothetical protein
MFLSIEILIAYIFPPVFGAAFEPLTELITYISCRVPSTLIYSASNGKVSWTSMNTAPFITEPEL